MLPREYDEQNCSIARALEVIGERWTMLILRDAALGIHRFEDLQGRLGVSRTVLASRLSALVESGVMERRRYQQRPDRYEYVLSARGEEIVPAIIALGRWGGRHFSPNGTPREFRHATCGEPVSVEVRCAHCDVAVEAREILTAPTPGTPVSRADHLSEPVVAALSSERPLMESVHAGG